MSDDDNRQQKKQRQSDQSNGGPDPDMGNIYSLLKNIEESQKSLEESQKNAEWKKAQQAPAGRNGKAGTVDLKLLVSMITNQEAQARARKKAKDRKAARAELERRRAVRLEGIRAQTQQLPAYNMKDALLQSIKERRVTIVAGSCGCGKSTQVPQYILDDYTARGKKVRILVTQPRRLATTSIAARVATERGTRLGSEVGFRIGGRECCQKHTKLLFVTTAVLREMLLHTRALRQYTHVIMDEVHERSIDIDITAACLKQILTWNQRLRLVIMSATIHCSHFADYFAGAFKPKLRPLVLEDLEGASTEEHNSLLEKLMEAVQEAPEGAWAEPVESILQEAPCTPPSVLEALEQFGYGPQPRVDPERNAELLVALRDLWQSDAPQKQGPAEGAECGGDVDMEQGPAAASRDRRPADPAPVIRLAQDTPYQVAFRYLDDVVRDLEMEPRERMGVVYYASDRYKTPRVSDERKEFFWKYFKWLHRTKHMDNKGTFLLFLPGSAMIREFKDKILALTDDGTDVEVHTLHSTVPIEDQQKVMLPADCGKRKVILSTNIAESSITVPDVMAVIDFCLVKEMHWDPQNQNKTLDDVWESKSSAEQRAGRAGRVCTGEVYRWVSNKQFNSFPDEPQPQIMQFPLDTMILKILQIKWGEPEKLLAQTLDPPPLQNINMSYQQLIDIGAVSLDKEPDPATQAELDRQMSRKEGIAVDELKALSSRYSVTKIGRVIATLNAETLPCLLILYGAVFGVLEECLVMASIVSKKSPILLPIAVPVQAARTNAGYAAYAQSDLIAGLHAYLYWQKCKRKGAFSVDNEYEWCKGQQLSLFFLREVEDNVVQLKEDLARFHYCTAPSLKQKRRMREHRRAVIPGTVDAVLQKADEAMSDEERDEEEAPQEGPEAGGEPSGKAATLEEFHRGTGVPDDEPAEDTAMASADAADVSASGSDGLAGAGPGGGEGAGDGSGAGASAEGCGPSAPAAGAAGAGGPSPSAGGAADADDGPELDPDDPLAAVLRQIDHTGLYTAAQASVGVDPDDAQKYRGNADEDDSDDEEDDAGPHSDSMSDSSASETDSEYDDEGLRPRRVRHGVKEVELESVVLEPGKLRLLRMLIAAAFMPHMHAVQLEADRSSEDWEEQNVNRPPEKKMNPKYTVKLSGFNRPLARGDAHSIRHRFEGPEKVGEVKQLVTTSANHAFVEFDPNKEPEQQRNDEDFCDRFALSIRLAGRTATRARRLADGHAAKLTWSRVSYHPHYAAHPVPLFHAPVPVIMDDASVAKPLLLRSKDEDEWDTVTMIPASMHGVQRSNKLMVSANTILYGRSKREMAMLLFARNLKLEKWEGEQLRDNIYKVCVPLRGHVREFFVQMSGKVLWQVRNLRAFVNRRIMLPEEQVEEKEYGAVDVDELLWELNNLNMNDQVGAEVKRRGLGNDDDAVDNVESARRILSDMEKLCGSRKQGKPAEFMTLWHEARITARHTVSCVDNLVLNKRLLKSSLERSIYANPDLALDDPMQDVVPKPSTPPPIPGLQL